MSRAVVPTLMAVSRWIEAGTGVVAGAAALGGLVARVVSPSPEFVFPWRGTPVSSWAVGSRTLLEEGLTPRLAVVLGMLVAGAAGTALGAAWHSATRRRAALALSAAGTASLMTGSGGMLNLGALSLIATHLLFYDREMGVNIVRVSGLGTVGGSAALALPTSSPLSPSPLAAGVRSRETDDSPADGPCWTGRAAGRVARPPPDRASAPGRRPAWPPPAGTCRS
jgi:hypothetical protein